ncbi:MAG: hypothetical protein M3069_22495 [Chloroflexota bacterium]|nr:hypothetical protein [Chloroflexota bacterium]
MANGIEIDWATAARAFGDTYFNLLRRGADGSLSLSSDHWRLEAASETRFRFTAQEDDAPLLELSLAEVDRVVWDRLPKQTTRSQIRFSLSTGDLWTFSGKVNEAALK